MSNDPQSPLYPWRLDTNERYREVVKILMNLSTASLILPIFFLRDILEIPKSQPLYQVLTCKIYFSWISLSLAILFGITFFYASAKWVRLAWGKEAGFFGRKTTDNFVEKLLNFCFVGTILSFVLGLALTIWFVVSFRQGA